MHYWFMDILVITMLISQLPVSPTSAAGENYSPWLVASFLCSPLFGFCTFNAPISPEEAAIAVKHDEIKPHILFLRKFTLKVVGLLEHVINYGYHIVLKKELC